MTDWNLIKPETTGRPFRIFLNGKYHGVVYAETGSEAIASMKAKLGIKFETTLIRAAPAKIWVAHPVTSASD